MTITDQRYSIVNNLRSDTLRKYDVIIIGAGAAGLMCAWQLSLRGINAAIIEHTGRIAEKIRISGGGKCNFTNLYTSPNNYISQNPHFCKSALKRFGPEDFIDLIKDNQISYHEKKYEEDAHLSSKGQLFCDKSAQDIIDMLHYGFINNEGRIYKKTKVQEIQKTKEGGFVLNTNNGELSSNNLVIATGGLSIPKIGASNFGYEIAKRFGLNIIPPKAGLVPLTFDDELLTSTKELSGISVDAVISCGSTCFREGLLFTHRGLSGPSILQISSYWQGSGLPININMLPDIGVFEYLKEKRLSNPKQELKNILSAILPARLAVFICNNSGHNGKIADLSDKKLKDVASVINHWEVFPSGSEGYRTAEITVGGVDTNEISSKTFESKKVEGLYFIGEVLDVTGHLGGHNFQWAWSSGWCCAQSIC